MQNEISCLGQVPSDLEFDTVVDITRHADRGPLKPSSVDPDHTVWQENEYEQLTLQGQEAAKEHGRQVAKCYKSLGLLDDVVPKNIYIRSTNVARTELTAQKFMEGFAKECDLQTSPDKHIPSTSENEASKDAIVVQIMPQGGIKRVGGSGDFLENLALLNGKNLASHKQLIFKKN